MKLSLQSIQNKDAWKGYHLPSFDPAEIAANTAKKPQWLHFGSGNIFRIFPAALCQRLIEQGKIDTTPLITHRCTLAGIKEGYRIFENRLDGVIKVAVTPR